jgi:para-nitrobenzyl esterase
MARPWRRSAAAALHLLAVAGLVAQASAAPAAQPPAAKSAQGWLVGESSSGGGAVFRGVPYAAPPLGSLRWRAPQAPQPWRGRRMASAAAAPCLQADYGWNAGDAARSSEDCLYLDIHTPDLHPHRPLPVMVWIHGGSNRAGSAGDTMDSGITRRGVLLVSIQYRLGVFGFLSHPALTRESRRRAAGNFGLLDQIAALHWVRHNIAAFGGDARTVTVFGHSAGAEDVGQLLVSPLAHGLFCRAIEQSGSPAFGLPPRSLADNEAIGLQLARLLGVGADAAALVALRSRDAHEILAAAEALRSPSLRDPSYLWLQVVVDGQVLPLAPRELLAAGRSNPVALIIGSNTRELTVPGGDAQTDAFLAESFGANDAAARSLYGYMPNGPLPASDARYGSFSERLSGDVIFRCPAARTAELQAAAGYPVWQYQFGHIDSERPLGHAAELPFVFDDLPLGAAPDEPAVSLQSYWVAFAQRGDPNGPALPAWPRYDPNTRGYMDFSATGPQAASNPGGSICALLDRV